MVGLSSRFFLGFFLITLSDLCVLPDLKLFPDLGVLLDFSELDMILSVFLSSLISWITYLLGYLAVSPLFFFFKPNP